MSPFLEELTQEIRELKVLNNKLLASMDELERGLNCIINGRQEMHSHSTDLLEKPIQNINKEHFRITKEIEEKLEKLSVADSSATHRQAFNLIPPRDFGNWRDESQGHIVGDDIQAGVAFEDDSSRDGIVADADVQSSHPESRPAINVPYNLPVVGTHKVAVRVSTSIPTANEE
ncbi:hypothetical protein BDQ17DRAFT_1421773 [Cyathus striatus]|nr:hypothetical protein BDQ17DRAFT_1421773 [Cyathus striatus]